MIAKDDILELLKSTESYRVERTVSTGNMDKFCEAICAFANDMPGSRKNGYLIIGAKDDGSIAGMKVDDALLNIIAKTKRATFQNETSKTSLFSLPLFSWSFDRLNIN